MNGLTKEQIISMRFAIAFEELVSICYCLGGASRDEILAACVDCLETLSRQYKNMMKEDAYVPPYR